MNVRAAPALCALALLCAAQTGQAMAPPGAAQPPSREAALAAFQAEPSWERFVKYGDALHARLLTEAQREQELKAQKARRWRVAEFEAMKERLRGGMQVSAEREIEPAAKRVPRKMVADLPRDALPAARPSLFKSRSEIAFETNLDQAAGLRNGTITLQRVLRGPQFQRDRSDSEWFDGTWDVGQAELSVEPAAVTYSLAANGLLGAAAVSQVIATPGPQGGECGTRAVGSTLGWKPKRERPIKGYARVPKEKALVTFYSSHDLKPELVRVQIRAFRAELVKRDGSRLWDKIAVHEIDFDRDGAADLVVIKSIELGTITERLERIRILVNVGGVWSAEWDETEADCT